MMVCATGRGEGRESGSRSGGGGGRLSDGAAGGRADLRAGVEVTRGGSTLPSTTMEAPQRLQ
jgi:hypothetical protein